MIIKDITLWLLENTELLPRSKHDRILEQHTRLKIISYYCGRIKIFKDASGSNGKKMKILRSNHEF